MFERFTEHARRAVVLAQEQARSLRHGHVGTEHLLLGLLGEQEGLAARVLGKLGVGTLEVREQATRIAGPGAEVTSGQIPFTPRAKKVMEMALREALSLGHNHIGTEHVLLAIVREHEGVAMRILLDLDVDGEMIRNLVLRMAAGPSGRRRGPTATTVENGLAPRTPLDWQRASMLWRPAGLELRIPLRLNEGAIATFAADQVWADERLAGMRREIWNGWLALSAPTLLEEIDAVELRRLLDAAAKRASDVSGREGGRVQDFLRRLRDEPDQPGGG